MVVLSHDVHAGDHDDDASQLAALEGQIIGVLSNSQVLVRTMHVCARLLYSCVDGCVDGTGRGQV